MSKRKIKKHIQYEIFMIPALVLFTTLTIFPLFRTLLYSVTDFDGVTHGYEFVGLDNYIRMFKDADMLQSIGNTLLYAFCMVIGVNLISLPLAVLLDGKAKSKGVERAIFFFPSVVSPLLLGYIWGYILSSGSTGAVNSMLQQLGFSSVPWLANPYLAKLSIFLLGLWTRTGWHTMVNIAYLQAVPDDYYAAARIDGAGRWQLFWKITIPMMAPAFTINTLLLLTDSLKVYDLPYALTKGGPGTLNYTITQTIIQRGISDKQYGLSSAMSVVFVILIMIVAILQYRGMSKREEDIG